MSNNTIAQNNTTATTIIEDDIKSKIQSYFDGYHGFDKQTPEMSIQGDGDYVNIEVNFFTGKILGCIAKPKRSVSNNTNSKWCYQASGEKLIIHKMFQEFLDIRQNILTASWKENIDLDHKYCFGHNKIRVRKDTAGDNTYRLRFMINYQSDLTGLFFMHLNVA